MEQEPQQADRDCYCSPCSTYFKSIFEEYLHVLQHTHLHAAHLIELADQFPDEASWVKHVNADAKLAREALVEVFRPRSLKALGLERVGELGLSLEELPCSLRREVGEWPRTREGILRERAVVVVEAVRKF